MPRYPRPATPLPTDEPALETFVKRIQLRHALVAIAVVLVGAGATAATFAASKADVAELHQVRDGAAASLASTQAGTSAQLGALQATVQDLRARQAGVDASLAALTADVARLNGSADRLYLQLVEIARATGARQVSGAATSSPPTRPP